MFTDNQVIQIQQMNAETLLSRFETIIDKKLGALIVPPDQSEPEKLKTKKEIAEFLGISLVTIWQLEKKGLIQGYRLGNGVRYKQSEILANLQLIQRPKK